MNLSTALWKADSLRTTVERPLRVSGGNYNPKHSAGCFWAHTGPSVFILANFGSRPQAYVIGRVHKNPAPSTMVTHINEGDCHDLLCWN